MWSMWVRGKRMLVSSEVLSARLAQQSAAHNQEATLKLRKNVDHWNWYVCCIVDKGSHAPFTLLFPQGITEGSWNCSSKVRQADLSWWNNCAFIERLHSCSQPGAGDRKWLAVLRHGDLCSPTPTPVRPTCNVEGGSIIDGISFNMASLIIS